MDSPHEIDNELSLGLLRNKHNQLTDHVDIFGKKAQIIPLQNGRIKDFRDNLNGQSDALDNNANLEKAVFTIEEDGEKEEAKDEKSVSIFPQKWKSKHILPIADNIISVMVIGPLVVGHWRGGWGLMDFYNLRLVDWQCFLIGTGLHWLFAYLRHLLHRTIAERWRLSNPIGRGAYKASRLTYTYCFCLSCILQWRGGWAIFDSIVGENLWIDAAVTCALIIILLILKSIRNLLAPPFVIVVDIPPHIFNFPTRYRANSRDCTLYILDCAFSVGVVGTLVVFAWRGIWVLLDHHLFPESKEYSAIGSMVIGYIIVGVTFCFQPVMRYVCSRLQGLTRLLVADVFLLLSFLGTVNVWRGIWGLLEVWLFPEDVGLSCWITHIGCLLFLGLLNCSNSILVRGVYIDAEEEEGKCVVFPCHYLRLFFKIEREKKEARRRHRVSSSCDYVANDRAGKDPENGALLNCTTVNTILPANPECLVLK